MLSRLSIKNKLRLTIATIVAAALLLTCSVFVVRELRRIPQNMVEKTHVLVEIVANNATAALSFHDKDTAAGLLAALSAEERLVAACIYGADGEVFASYERKGDEGFQFPRVQPDGHAFTERGLEQYHPVTLDGEQIGTVFLNSDMAERNEAIARLVTTTAVVLVISLVVALGLAELLQRSIVKPLQGIIDRFAEIAEGDGDLTQRVDESRRDELGELGRGFNRFVEKIHDIVAAVKMTTSELTTSATSISASGVELANGMNQQTQRVSQVAASIEQMTQSVQEVAQKAANAANNAARAGKAAEEGGEVVRQTIAGMEAISDSVAAGAQSVQELGKRGEQIGAIIQVINDIADQTNLLALNAAIEAARAGEHGRGFAVVADEVRKLADRTTKATDEIAESIKAIQTETGEAVRKMEAGTAEVTHGVERAGHAGDSLRNIVAAAQEVARMIESIAAASEEQSSASGDVAKHVETMAEMIRLATSSCGETATAVNELASKAEHLQSLVNRFRLKEAAHE